VVGAQRMDVSLLPDHYFKLVLPFLNGIEESNFPVDAKNFVPNFERFLSTVSMEERNVILSLPKLLKNEEIN